MTLPVLFHELAEAKQAEGEALGFTKAQASGETEGKAESLSEGELKGRREPLLRLLTRAKIVFADSDLARIQDCSHAETLDRWIENVLGATSIGEVLT